mgnify:CR=1 FL=1
MRPLPQIPEWVKLEHKVAQILTKQEIHGWHFDERAAWELASSLRTELEQTCELLRNRHPFVKGSEFTPKRDNKTSGYVKGCPFTKLKETNPTSRDHISWILQTFHGCFGVSEMSRYYEELGDDLRRHQRMAQVEYEC